MSISDLIGEATTYDKKLSLERTTESRQSRGAFVRLSSSETATLFR